MLTMSQIHDHCNSYDIIIYHPFMCKHHELCINSYVWAGYGYRYSHLFQSQHKHIHYNNNCYGEKYSYIIPVAVTSKQCCSSSCLCALSYHVECISTKCIFIISQMHVDIIIHTGARNKSWSCRISDSTGKHAPSNSVDLLHSISLVKLLYI
jgi:hypothetical protein